MPPEKYKQDLLNLILRVKDKVSLDKLLRDLLTPREYEEIIKRWQIIKQLYRGTSQRQISNNLKVSIATVTRGSRELRNKKGGFWKALKK